MSCIIVLLWYEFIINKFSLKNVSTIICVNWQQILQQYFTQGGLHCTYKQTKYLINSCAHGLMVNKPGKMVQHALLHVVDWTQSRREVWLHMADKNSSQHLTLWALQRRRYRPMVQPTRFLFCKILMFLRGRRCYYISVWIWRHE